MSLAKSDVIDVVALMPDRETVSLVAHDGGEISAEREREHALQKKLLGYLQFVVSGQFAKMHPEHAGRKVVIQVVCSVPPTDGMRRVHGIRDHNRPETFLGVQVLTHDEFRAAMARSRSQRKAWWRFWG